MSADAYSVRERRGKTWREMTMKERACQSKYLSYWLPPWRLLYLRHHILVLTHCEIYLNNYT